MSQSLDSRTTTSNSDPELILWDSEPGEFAFYTWKNIMLVCWIKQGTGPAVQRLIQLRKSIDDQHPSGLSVIHLIADNAGLPTAEARAGVAELMERYKHKRACLGILIQGGGFWASAMRAAVTGTRIVAPGKFQMRIFSRVEEIAKWLPKPHAEHTGIEINSGHLLSVLKDLESKL